MQQLTTVTDGEQSSEHRVSGFPILFAT